MKYLITCKIKHYLWLDQYAGESLNSKNKMSKDVIKRIKKSYLWHQSMINKNHKYSNRKIYKCTAEYVKWLQEYVQAHS